MRIHHIGIVANDVDEVLKSFNLSRADIKETVYDDNQKNNLHFIYLADNNMWLELVEPVGEGSSVSTFAKKNGIGLHHIAMKSEAIESIEEAYNKRTGNFVLGRYKIVVNSFGGKIRTLFIAAKGLLMEFVSDER